MGQVTTRAIASMKPQLAVVFLFQNHRHAVLSMRFECEIFMCVISHLKTVRGSYMYMRKLGSTVCRYNCTGEQFLSSLGVCPHIVQS